MQLLLEPPPVELDDLAEAISEAALQRVRESPYIDGFNLEHGFFTGLSLMASTFEAVVDELVKKTDACLARRLSELGWQGNCPVYTFSYKNREYVCADGEEVYDLRVGLRGYEHLLLGCYKDA
jgi:hypothetical protein